MQTTLFETGKRPQTSKLPKGCYSNLHNEYSDWHKGLANWCYMTDLDQVLVGKPYIYRLWIEVRGLNGGLTPVAMIDIKRPNDKLTLTEKAVYGYFEEMGLPVYIVWIRKFQEFKVQRFVSKQVKIMDEKEYKQFIEQKQIVL